MGEHAVVYGRPAIAVPLPRLRARATARFDPNAEDVTVRCARGPIVSLTRDPEHPLARTVALALEALGASPTHIRAELDSAIPVASGLGSGASVSTAIVRALADLLGRDLPPERLSPIVYEIERIHHGTPSGIDNTVVVYERPVYFVKGQEPRFLAPGAALHLVLADTGVASATREAVAAFRRLRQSRPDMVEARLDTIGELVDRARDALTAGDAPRLGQLLDAVHEVLAELDVSNEALDRLVAAARAAGALGAKLTGAGRGGHAIALVSPESAAPVMEALRRAGAARVTLCRL